MKKRLGFVSNSSSSSFLIIGKTINQEDINEDNVKDIIAQSAFEGEYGNLWIEFKSMDMLNKYIEVVKRESFDGYDTTYYHAKIRKFDYEGQVNIKPEDIEEGSIAYFGTCDQYVLCSESDIEEATSWGY